MLAPLLAVACGSGALPEWREGSTRNEGPTTSLFESGDLDDLVRRDTFLRDWYSKHLFAAGETSLRVSSADEVYRFTHLPSFRHPLVIRVEDRDGRRRIIAKELDGAGGYEPGRLVIDRHRELTPAEWRQVQAELIGMRFGALPKHECESRGHPDDGFVWILEGKWNSNYSLVQWHWDECSACLYLAQLAEVRLDGVTPSRTPRPSAVPLPSEFAW